MWRDAKYLIAYIAPLAALAGVHYAGWMAPGAFYVAFVIVPLAEFVARGNTDNLTEKEEQSQLSKKFFDAMLYLNVPLLLGTIVYFLFRMSSGDLTGLEQILMTINVGVGCGVYGINVAHELGHRDNKFERLMSLALLLPNHYMHFIIEHNHGHHKYVSTPEDPASSRLGENFYFFYFRSVLMSYISAWKIEKTFLERAGKSFWNPIANRMIQFTIIHIVYLTFIVLYFGPIAFYGAIGIGIIGFSLLELVNYIEHYGLLRNKLPNGRYEPVQPWHSWNSNHDLGRIFLYELTRHSDHHFKANRKYQVLRHFDESPQLPLGYPGSMMLALVPPLWFKFMDKEVHKFAERGLVAVG